MALRAGAWEGVHLAEGTLEARPGAVVGKQAGESPRAQSSGG